MPGPEDRVGGGDPSAGEITGVWRLASFHDVDAEGSTREGPLGPDPTGLLFYSPEGHVSVTMMRAVEPRGPGEPPAERPARSYMSYAGTWRRLGDQVVHTITVAPDPGWIGTDQVRDLTLEGDRLTLYGDALVGRPQRRVLEWHRVIGAD
ncbi:lipocalin-like domain-containing protein [Streptomyces sp. NPDC059096]|uniref:lipocalin-like domain-containing protein n=1 Tax=Streptomyces sp. NPDC059096 TaxID=3346727 RepID=UPI00367D32ED